jgi:PBP1b-binding outer membrane lipoprotein LpoB
MRKLIATSAVAILLLAGCTSTPAENTTPAADIGAAWEQVTLAPSGAASLEEASTAEGADPNNPIYSITKWKDMYDGTIRVQVADPINTDEAKKVGVHIFNMVGKDWPNLDTIVVQGGNGIDTNVRRFEAPLAG